MFDIFMAFMRACQRRFRCFLCHFSNSCHYVYCTGTRASPERRLPQRAGQDAALAQHCTGLGECAADRRPARGGCAVGVRGSPRDGRGGGWGPGADGHGTAGGIPWADGEGRRRKGGDPDGWGDRPAQAGAGWCFRGARGNAGKVLRRWPPPGGGAAAIARGARGAVAGAPSAGHAKGAPPGPGAGMDAPDAGAEVGSGQLRIR